MRDLQAGCTLPPATHCILFPSTYCTAQLFVPQHPPYGQPIPTISADRMGTSTTHTSWKNSRMTELPAKQSQTSGPWPQNIAHAPLTPSQPLQGSCALRLIQNKVIQFPAGVQQIRDLRIDHTTAHCTLLPQDPLCQSSPPTPASSIWIDFLNKISSSYRYKHHLCQ